MAFALETVQLDLPPLVGGFGRRLHDAGVPVSAERSTRFADALRLTEPVSRRRLYWTARAVFVSDPTQVRAFDAVFAEVFGGHALPAAEARLDEADHLSDPPELDAAPVHAHPDGDAASLNEPGRRGEALQNRDVAVPTIASDEELIKGKRFDALESDELATLYRLMSELSLATPERRTRRSERFRHGARIDLRRTLRGSMRTAGDPLRLARRRRRVVPRRIVLLCDISGSMEPYARVYLQFLTLAASGQRNEAFAFATRLTRLTRALHSRNPERAIQQAALTAPDWSSGTRIGDALKTFNDRHGRRGMARGAVVVILSDGWERGEPGLVQQEMERLARLAYRIVWVNPRAGADDFSPRTGGMAAALPYCDALVSGHTLERLSEVIDAIGADSWRISALDRRGRPRDPAPTLEAEEEPWPSATPVPGSSVAMPSGYGPSRGRTTPGWGKT